ncbi:hypothetical protein [Mesorhizobium sp. M0060]|uniref:hypothetical protein n=1 Tax=Mesorhizobium sp. M0060 TaxID=2956866 RepID=UPI0033391EC5
MTFYVQNESPGEDKEPLRRCDARLYEDADHVLAYGIRTMAETSPDKVAAIRRVSLRLL